MRTPSIVICLSAKPYPAAHVKPAPAAGGVCVNDALLDGLALELREDHHDHQHGLADRGGGIELFHCAGKADRMGLKHVDHVGKIQHGAADAVEPVDDHPLDPARGDILHHLLKGRAVGVFAAVALIRINAILVPGQLLFAVFRLAFDRNAVRPVDRLPGVDRFYPHGASPLYAKETGLPGKAASSAQNSAKSRNICGKYRITCVRCPF